MVGIQTSLYCSIGQIYACFFYVRESSSDQLQEERSSQIETSYTKANCYDFGKCAYRFTLSSPSRKTPRHKPHLLPGVPDLLLLTPRSYLSLADAPSTVVNQAHSHVGLTNLTQSSSSNANPSTDPSTNASTNPNTNTATKRGKARFDQAFCTPCRRHIIPGGSQDQWRVCLLLTLGFLTLSSVLHDCD